ncbi:T9SS type A sorting domain-containing protein [Flavilitoribacter nigricans]|uniref:Secretion system C-terminal sorting domain-containing protein n=1 Tax=Flavilitoribacter nigricans (strain ATCC 23147 / DSM 23189 / NBRC 102662 / NCIMB 1420 / SS-2) TaxID=1122177 RepID=A0A2D0N9R1_FLAN2|nr:T9SS type A sorting domain-containing protein [Flavilitoribacter nigricans]PHN04879.1 hypothetical protein CRP01_20445 [Flavilitoribacter nigricans DSM 23189 = NBRC 102662]
MKKVVRILTVVAVMMVAQWNLQAQRPHPGPPDRGPGLERFAEELEITDEQKAELKALHETQREEAKALMEKEYETREARWEAMKALRESHKDAMDAILTEAQLAKLETLKAEAKAQREARHEERMENVKAMRGEMKTYRETEIEPVLRAQRTKLEEELSAEDKATIAAIRAKHPTKREDRPDFKAGERGKRPELTDEQKAEMRADREKIKALVEKYDSEITSLLDEIKDDREEWKEDMQEIGKKYAPEDLKDRPARGKRGEMKGKRLGDDKRAEAPRREMEGRHHRGGKMDREHFGKVGFLLMDPNAETEAATAPAGDFAEVRVFPNPSASRNTVSYKLRDAGHYRVELRDKDGLVLEVLSNEYRQSGEYREELDLTSYAAGTYYLSIVGAEGVVSKKVVVAK